MLGSLVDGCQGALDEVSPWLDLVDRIGGAHDEAVIRFSLVAARQQAWRVAEQLHGLRGAERLAAIDAVDGAAAKVGHAVRASGAGGERRCCSRSGHASGRLPAG